MNLFETQYMSGGAIHDAATVSTTIRLATPNVDSTKITPQAAKTA